jgi:hypothetical protein
MFSFFPIIAIIGFVFIVLQIFLRGSSSDDDDKTKKRKKPKPGVDHYTKSRDKLTMKSKQNDVDKKIARKLRSTEEQEKSTATMNATQAAMIGMMGGKK